MKKIIAAICAFTILAVSSAFAADIQDSRITSQDDQRISHLSGEMAEVLKEKIAAGADIYYGKGVKESDNSTYSSDQVTIDTVKLPESAAVFDFDMEYGDGPYRSPYWFEATKDCNMVVWRNEGSREDGYNSSFKVNFQLYCDDDSDFVYSRTYSVSSNQVRTYIPLEKGKRYRIYVTPLTEGLSWLNLLISGE